MAAITLDDVVIEQMETNETLSELDSKTRVLVISQADGFQRMVDKFQEFIDFSKGAEERRILAENEAARERERDGTRPDVLPEAPDSGLPKIPTGDESMFTGFQLALGAGVAATVATATGYLQSWYKIVTLGFRSFSTDMAKLTTSLGKLFAPIGRIITSVGGALGRFFGITDDVVKVFGALRAFFDPFGKFISLLAKSGFVQFAGNFFKAVGRVAAPLLLLIDVFKGVTKEVGELEEDATIFQTLGAVLEGVVRGIANFVFFPIDLLKKVLSFILGFVGFESLENALDSFSFAELAGDLTMFVLDIPAKIAGFLGDSIKKLINMYFNLFSNIFNTIGVGLNVMGQMAGQAIDSLIEKLVAIPESIFEWFGGLFDTISATVSEKLSGVMSGIGDFFGNLFDFTEIKKKLTYMFAEIGIPRIEFDLPIIGKVGFGPFYPFATEAGSEFVNASNSIESRSESTANGYTNIEDQRSGVSSIGSLSLDENNAGMTGSRALTSQTYTTDEGGDTVQKSDKVFADFDYESGKGTVSFTTNTFFDNLESDTFGELENLREDYEIGPVTMGRIRRMIDAGATPEQVRQFIILEQQTISEKMSSVLSSTKERVGAAMDKAVNFFGFGGDEQVAESISGVNTGDSRPLTAAIEGGTMESVANSQSSPPVIVQDNSVIAPQTSTNVTQMGDTPVAAATKDNGTRLSAAYG